MRPFAANQSEVAYARNQVVHPTANVIPERIRGYAKHIYRLVVHALLEEIGVTPNVFAELDYATGIPEFVRSRQQLSVPFVLSRPVTSVCAEKVLQIRFWPVPHLVPTCVYPSRDKVKGAISSVGSPQSMNSPGRGLRRQRPPILMVTA